jgi:hypothetical protein
MYLHADLALKEKLLADAKVPEGSPAHYHPDDKLLSFLKKL